MADRIKAHNHPDSYVTVVVIRLQMRYIGVVGAYNRESELRPKGWSEVGVCMCVCPCARLHVLKNGCTDDSGWMGGGWVDEWTDA